MGWFFRQMEKEILDIYKISQTFCKKILWERSYIWAMLSKFIIKAFGYDFAGNISLSFDFNPSKVPCNSTRYGDIENCSVLVFKKDLLRLLSWRMIADSVLFMTHSSSLPMPSGSTPRHRCLGSMFLFTSGMAFLYTAACEKTNKHMHMLAHKNKI